MKIIICVSNDLSFDQRMIRIASSLSKFHEVTLVGRKRKSSTAQSKMPFIQKRLNVFFENGILFYLFLNIRLFFYLLFNPFDMVYSVDLDTIVPCTAVKILKNKRSIFDAHEIFEETPELIGRNLKRKIWILVAKIFIPLQDKCITVGSQLKHYLSDKYRNQFTVIRNVPFKLNSKDNKSHNPYILYQGALNAGRGLEELIEAMQDIRPNYKLIIIGEGDLSVSLREKAANSPRSTDIEFLGYIHPQDLSNYTNQAYIGVNLIKKESLSYYYSLANKFFDYVQVYLPSINMNYPEYKQLNDQIEVSLLIDNLEPKVIAESINTLIDDQLLYDTLKSNCKIAAEEWNWENEEKILLDIFN